MNIIDNLFFIYWRKRLVFYLIVQAREAVYCGVER